MTHSPSSHTQWPISIYFPLAMWIKLFQPMRRVCIVLHTVSICALLVTLLAIIGSVQGIVVNASSFTYAWSS